MYPNQWLMTMVFVYLHLYFQGPFSLSLPGPSKEQ